MLKFKTFETSKDFEKWQKDNEHLDITIISMCPIANYSIGNNTQTDYDYGIYVIYRFVEK